MDITRFDTAGCYPVPKHNDMVAFRLQGQGVTSAQGAWVGLSYFLPGGGAEYDVSTVEKIYVVIEGEITVDLGSATHTLKRYDSCVIPAGEGRSLLNTSKDVTKMLVIVPSVAVQS
jgi:glyoxylate utilization-related uncharacterized protein